jgi:hypothetical protein
MTNAGFPDAVLELVEVQATAKTLGLELAVLEIRRIARAVPEGGARPASGVISQYSSPPRDRSGPLFDRGLSRPGIIGGGRCCFWRLGRRGHGCRSGNRRGRSRGRDRRILMGCRNRSFLFDRLLSRRCDRNRLKLHEDGVRSKARGSKSRGCLRANRDGLRLIAIERKRRRKLGSHLDGEFTWRPTGLP